MSGTIVTDCVRVANQIPTDDRKSKTQNKLILESSLGHWPWRLILRLILETDMGVSRNQGSIYPIQR